MEGVSAELIFSCRIESNKIFSDLLNSLIEKERKDQLCHFEVTPESKLKYVSYLYFILTIVINVYIIKGLTMLISSKSKATQVSTHQIIPTILTFLMLHITNILG